MNPDIKERLEKIHSGIVPTGYKKTKIGMIPDEWIQTQFHEICKGFKNGGTPSTKDIKYWQGDIPWITGADINDYKINDIRRYISEEAVTKSSTNVIEQGNLLIVTRTGVGKLTIAPFKVAISQDLTGVSIKKELVDIEYIFYYLIATIQLLSRLNQGTSINGITRNTLRGHLTNIPPLPEQHRIAEILSTWDKDIELKEILLDQKKLQKKGLMQQLLTGKKRTINLETEKMFEGEWQEVRLGDVFVERLETNYCNLPLLSIGEEGVYPQTESNKKDTSNSNKSKYKRICPNDIGYNTMRMWQGRSALSKLEGIVSPAYTILKPLEITNSLFFSYLFKMHGSINIFRRYSQGLVDDTLNLKYRHFKIIKMTIPIEKIEQKTIASILTQVDQKIVLLEKEIEYLKEQKRGLMQLLLTGIVRVKE